MNIALTLSLIANAVLGVLLFIYIRAHRDAIRGYNILLRHVQAESKLPVIAAGVFVGILILRRLFSSDDQDTPRA